jgi:hypothetical protein
VTGVPHWTAGCGEAVPEAEGDEDGEGCEEKYEQADGAVADGGRAAEVPAQQTTTTARDQA